MITVISGDWGVDSSKVSKIGQKIASDLGADSMFNGGFIKDLPKQIQDGLCVWMPNIDNNETKVYPVKNPGTMLVITKRIRREKPIEEEIGSGISRIFSLKANAVICIDSVSGRFNFSLYDALGNMRCCTQEIGGLCSAIMAMYKEHKEQVRMRTMNILKTDLFADFIGFVKSIQNLVEQSCGIRYFGNASTRCSAMFPSARMANLAFVSKRNISKATLDENSFVPVMLDSEKLINLGSEQPSVDSAMQCLLYKKFTEINFMVHGHAEISGDFVTEINEHYQCGDVREAIPIFRIVPHYDDIFYAFNLSGHGFLLLGDSVDTLRTMTELIKFDQRIIEIYEPDNPFNKED